MKRYQQYEIETTIDEWENEGEGPYYYNGFEIEGIDCIVEGYQSNDSETCEIKKVNYIFFNWGNSDDNTFIPNQSEQKNVIKWAEENLGWLISRKFFDLFDPSTAMNEQDWHYDG